MIHISFFSSFSFHFLPLFLFRMPQTGSSPVCGLLFCTYAKNRRTAQGSSPVRLSKKSGTVKISQQIRNVLRNPKIGFCVPFFRSSLPILSLRGGCILAPDAAIFNESSCHSVTTMVERNETEPWNEERESGTTQRFPCFCDRDFFLFRASVLRHGMPYLRL